MRIRMSSMIIPFLVGATTEKSQATQAAFKKNEKDDKKSLNQDLQENSTFKVNFLTALIFIVPIFIFIFILIAKNSGKSSYLECKSSPNTYNENFNFKQIKEANDFLNKTCQANCENIERIYSDALKSFENKTLDLKDNEFAESPLENWEKLCTLSIKSLKAPFGNNSLNVFSRLERDLISSLTFKNERKSDEHIFKEIMSILFEYKNFSDKLTNIIDKAGKDISKLDKEAFFRYNNQLSDENSFFWNQIYHRNQNDIECK
jgi:hypothetical protein